MPQTRRNLTKISWGFSPVLTPRIICRTNEFALVADLKRREQPPYLAARQGEPKMRVTVVGTGISGSAAAWILSKHYPVRPGGHGLTVRVDQ